VLDPIDLFNQPLLLNQVLLHGLLFGGQVLLQQRIMGYLLQLGRVPCKLLTFFEHD